MHKFLPYNKSTICLYMFRALFAHHQEVKIVFIQHLVSSHCVGGRPVRRLGKKNSQSAHKMATYSE